MKIIKAYQTSKGIFLQKEEAEKKMNRSFERTPYSNGQKEYENVNEMFVLVEEIDGYETFFKLKEIEVQ